MRLAQQPAIKPAQRTARAPMTSMAPLGSVQRQPLSCACGGGCPNCRNERSLQTKLQVSQPGDALEREADQVADQVLHMPTAGDSAPVGAASPRISRMAQTPSTRNVPAEVHDTLGDTGQPLDLATRQYFEPRFGHDFSGVRVHNDRRAMESAQSISANAYTVGNDVVFNNGQYTPHSSAGQRLLAHELTHVVQQSNGAAPAVQRQWQESGAEEQEGDPHPGGVPERSTEAGKTMRVHAPTHPGWAPVMPVYTFFEFGEPYYLPHFAKVSVIEKYPDDPTKWLVTVQEGKYDGEDAVIDEGWLMNDPGSPGYATAVYDVPNAEFYWGGSGPPVRTAATTPDKVPPSGTYDIQMPDFPHDKASMYGPFATSWFLVGIGGDKYLHPGFSSIGCTTIEIKEGDNTTWPEIWRYLIDARSDDGVIGEIEIINPPAPKEWWEDWSTF